MGPKMILPHRAEDSGNGFPDADIVGDDEIGFEKAVEAEKGPGFEVDGCLFHLESGLDSLVGLEPASEALGHGENVAVAVHPCPAPLKTTLLQAPTECGMFRMRNDGMEEIGEGRLRFVKGW